MANSTVVKNLTDGSIALKDATGTPISVTVKFTTGDISITGMTHNLRETTAYEARGVLTSVRHTTRVYPQISFTCQMAEFASATATSALDAIAKDGAFAAGVSTLGANAEVWALDAVITVEGTDFGDSADPTLTMTKVRWTADWSEGDPNTFSLSGICYGAITGDIDLAEG